MKRVYFILLSFFVFVEMMAGTEIDGIYYNIDFDKRTAEVTKNGTGDYNGRIVIPSSVTGFGTVFNVTSIGNAAFYGCKELKSVIIPNSVTTIHDHAFAFSNLETITIPKSVTLIDEKAFWATSLEKVYIDDIKAWCNISFFDSSSNPINFSTHLFLNGQEVQNLNIPEGVTNIGNYAFTSYDRLTSVIIPQSIKTIGEQAFNGCYKINQITVKSDIPVCITANTFSCYSGATLYVPYGCKELYAATDNWKKFNNIEELPTNINGIFYTLDEEGMRATVHSLTFFGNIEIPSSVSYNGKTFKVTGIDDDAFYGCTELTSMIMPYSISQIGERAFKGCSNLVSIVIPDSVSFIGEYAFQECGSLSSINIPNNLSRIEESVFDGCYGLINISIPNSVTTIGEYAFSRCSGLTSITIPDSVRSIENGAFLYCSRLKSVIIGTGITCIGEKAFYECKNINNVTINKANPPTISNNSFSYNSNPILYVPFGCIDIYSTTNYWNNFKRIKESPETQVIDGICYTLEEKGMTATVCSLPNNEKYFNVLTVPSSISFNGKIYRVANIGDYAFQDCNSLTHITMPNSLDSIGNYSFNGCTGLTEITIPNSVTSIGYRAFKGCTGLTTISIPNSITSINAAFEDCFALASIIMPNSLTDIGLSSFQNCSDLTSIDIPKSVTNIGASAFEGCSGLTFITIPNSVTNIGTSAFKGCTGLASIEIPNSVASIGRAAFYGCTSLTSIIIPNGITKIEYGTFIGCTSLASVTLSNDIAHIDNSAFEGCTSLSSITIPESATKIGNSAFKDCSSLSSITISNNISSIQDYTFQGCIRLSSIIIPDGVTRIGDWAFKGCWNLTSVSIPDDITSIGTGAFWECKNLTDITIPEKLTAINEMTFGYCQRIKTIAIPDSVTSIGISAFEGCFCVTTINIPRSISTIHSSAFYNCCSLEDFYCHAEQVPIISSDIFEKTQIEYATLHVPLSAINKYKTTSPWSGFKEILPINNTPVLTYMLDNEVYKSFEIEVGAPITPEPEPTKEGYTFCGWSDIPETMPENNVTITGHFTINKYKLTYIIDGNEYKTYEIEYNSEITPEIVPMRKGMSFSGWEDVPKTMPAHDVIMTGAYSWLQCTLNNVIYQVKDTLNNYALVVGNNNANGDVVMLSSVRMEDCDYVVTNIDDFAFFQCNGLTSVSIPESITTIGQLAFATCTGMASITIPNSVTSIGVGAFAECTSLKTITIPESVTSISESLLSDCSSLTSITIPKNVTTIGDNAFAYCSNLKNVYSYPEQVPITADNAFENTPIQSAILQVSTTSSKELYKTTSPWSDFGSIIAQTDEEIAEDGPQLENSSFDDWHIVDNNGRDLYNPWKEGCASYWDTGNRGATTVGTSNSTYGTEGGRTYANLQSKFIVIKFAAGNIFTGAYLKTDGSNGIISLGRPFNSYPSKLQFDYTYKSSIVNKGGGKWDEKYSRYISQQTYDEMRGKPDSCCIWIALIGDKDEEEYDGVTYPYILRTRPSTLKLFDPNSDNVIAYGQFTCGDDQLEWTTRTITLNYRHPDEEPKYIIVVATSSKYGDFFIGGDGSLLKLDNLKLLYDGSIPIERQTFFAEQANGVQMEFGYISKKNKTCQVGSGTRTCISTETSGVIDIPSEVEGFSVVAVGGKAFYNCSGLTSITIPNSVTTIDRDAFSGCRLRNVLLRSQTPPAIDEDAFSKNIYNHTTLYIPNGSWDEYVFNSNWFQFINIRETITTEEQLSMYHAYTLMDANTFVYSVYDPVNDCIGTISSDGINEDNPNHSWQVIDTDGSRYLYNIGAKKFAVKARNDNGLILSDIPEPIEITDGVNGIVLGYQATNQWALVRNERLNIDQSAEEEVTGLIKFYSNQQADRSIYNLNGQRMAAPQKGTNIILMSDGTIRKVLIK